MPWLRRSFVTGFFVTVPLFISVAAFIWIFNVVDGLTTPLYDRLLGRRIPGLGIAVDGASAIVLVGAFATQRHRPAGAAARRRAGCCSVPVFRTIYAPVKQLVVGVFARQRVGLQARGDGRGRAARLRARVS